MKMLCYHLVLLLFNCIYIYFIVYLDLSLWPLPQVIAAPR